MTLLNNINRRFFLLAVVSFTASTVFTSCSSAQNNSANTNTNPSATPASNTTTTATKEKIKVGVSPVPAGEILEFVKKNLAPQAGLDIEIFTFSDSVQNNFALRDKQIDANYFQHVPFMEDFGKQHNIKMVALNPPIHLNPVGVYSKRHKSLAEVPKNGTVIIPGDINNAHRALKVIEEAGLVKLKTTAKGLVSPKDIAENPKNLQVKEVPATQMIPSLPDVDLAVMTGATVLAGGLRTDKDALALESSKNPIYAVTVTTLQGQENDPRIQKLYKLLRDDQVKQFIRDKYQGAVIPIP
ncbi:NLPA lipoprotein [Nostoc sp. FACHB-87]|uniref:MetQ/NlpA family ABC transporter substrate-binding protein n=1 Tax=Nostocaceae TaxID=1162 RepID=UPI0016861EC0|nr:MULTISPECIES: MetQ/NlpA family ABC transporter substrate-binding protein [Nostocaceae]MBD2454073.1 NLPA lipoprotein [Nostoc sp. FACHB-87]MBD2476232.1 NLPA lipoprotein [Anabaena sp. FACHB-83]